MNERTLVILKPDALQRSLIGKIINRFENTALKIEAIKLQNVTRKQAKKHYAEHIEKDYYSNLEDYITSAPVIVLVISGMKAINKVRLMVGATEPASALPGTIRGDYAHQSYPLPGYVDKKSMKNLIHSSANLEDAKREINIWFKPKDIIDDQISFN